MSKKSLQQKDTFIRFTKPLTRYALAMILTLFAMGARAQAWINTGNAGFSVGAVANTSLAFSGSTPYVAFTDSTLANKATVMKYIGSSWVNVGSAGFSAGGTLFTSLQFDGSTPYVSYSDVSNGNKATVMKYNGASWVTVGNAGFSAGTTFYNSFAINGSTPYVAFSDGQNAGKVTVMKYNGTSWITVGNAGFSPGNSLYISLAFDGSTPYVAYRDQTASGKITVKKYTGTSWVTVGSPSFSAGTVFDISLVVNGSTPFVAYRDQGVNGNRATVMEYDGSDWVEVGNAGFSTTSASYTSLAFNGSTPYVAYRSGVTNKANVMRYVGSNWVTVGSLNFSAGNAINTSLAFNGTIPYVAYADGGNGNKATVMRFDDCTLTSSFSQSICQGSSYMFNGIARTSSGTYLDTLVSTGGCDSIVTLNLTVKQTTSGSSSVTANGSYIFNGTTYTTSGTYSGTFTNSVGCDSVHTLNLTILAPNPPSVVVSNNTAGALTTYTFNYTTSVDVPLFHYLFLAQKVYWSAGYPSFQTYIPLTSSNAIVHLNSVPINLSSFAQIISTSSTLAINAGSIIPAGTNVSIQFVNVITNPTNAGTYNLVWRTADGGGNAYQTFSASVTITSGCTTTFGTINQSICQGSSYLFNGIARTTTGTYTDTLVNAGGCDSIVTLNLTVKPTSTGSSTVSAMGSYVFNSITYTSSGNYTGTFTNAVGCDSVHTLNLTIIPSTTPSVVVSNPLTNALTNYTFTYVTPVAVGPGSPNPFLFWHTYFLTSPTNYPDYQVYNPLTSANLSISVNGSPVALSNFIGMQSWNSGIQIMTLTYPIPAGSLIQITTSNIITNPSIPGNYNLTWRISDGAGGNPTWFNANTSITSPCVTSYSNLNAAICQGSSYLFNGIARTTTGTYTDTLVNAGGCDSIITLNLTVKPTSTGSSTVSALGSYVFNSITYTSSGTYTGTFTNAVGCDSVHTLNLTIIPNTPPSIVVSNPLTNALTNYTFTYVTPVAVGPGSPNPFLFWHTYFLTSPANYPDYQVYNPLTSANLSISINGSPVALSNFIGMQSWNSGIQIMTLTYPIAAGSLIQITTSNIITNPSIPGNYNLTWRISDGAGTNATWFNANTSITSPCVTSYSNINAAICQGSSYLFNGIAQTTAGTYTDTLVNAGGCDSMITLNLTVNQPTFNNTAASACDVYTWPVDGNTYTTSGTYTATSTNPAGCLHTETLNLTINNSTSNSTSATACDTYTWSVDGMTYTASGTYTASSTNAAGCVHTETLNLTIIPSTSNTTNASACNSYTWSVNNQTYTSSGTYTSTVGCVTEILNLSLGANTTVTTNASACVTYTWAVNNQTYTSSGSYSYVNGCSNEILNLTINPLPLVTAPNINSCPNSSITLGGSPAGGTWNLPNPYIGTATSYTYYFTDANGCTNSANGILSSITATISNLNMTTILGISATANWVGVNGIGWFEVRYKPTSSSIWIVSTTGSTPSKILPNLTPNTAYEVQARGFCTASNVGPWSPSVFFSTTNECGVPTGLFTNNISGTTAKLNWATTNAGFYTVRWKPVASSTWVSSTTTTTNKSIASLSLNTNYEFQVKSHCGSSSSSFSASDYFTTSTSRGGNTEVEIQQPSSSIAMYPNPTTGEVTLHIASRQYATVLINVLDMSGRIVKQIQTETLEGLNQIDMNISDLSNSVYSVQILNNGQLQGVERLIKN